VDGYANYVSYANYESVQRSSFVVPVSDHFCLPQSPTTVLSHTHKVNGFLDPFHRDLSTTRVVIISSLFYAPVSGKHRSDNPRQFFTCVTKNKTYSRCSARSTTNKYRFRAAYAYAYRREPKKTTATTVDCTIIISSFLQLLTSYWSLELKVFLFTWIPTRLRRGRGMRLVSFTWRA
jgi:hypothetical protein